VSEPREDGGGEAAGSERADEKRVAALEGEAQWLAGVGEPLGEDGGDGYRDASAQSTAKLVDFFAGGLHLREHTAGSRGDRAPASVGLTRRLLLRSPSAVTLGA
jgi:hypothetical protein